MDAIVAAARRRQALAKKIGDGVVALTAAPPAVRSRDTHHHPYRQDSYLYYLSGCAEPSTALLLAIAGGKIVREVFLCRPPDAVAARWEGAHLTPTRARRALGIGETAEIAQLRPLLADLAAGRDTLHYLPGQDAALDSIVFSALRARRSGNRTPQKFPAKFADIAEVLDEMRLIKDAYELAQLRRACQITADGVKAAMRAARTARSEGEVEAALLATYRRAGAHPAFPPIVASGRNACVLHYTANSARLRGTLLVDSGCEINGYAGDITRAFPRSGVWEGAYAEVYALVLSAQRAAIRAAKPGATLHTMQAAATRRLATGLRDLKLCRGSVAAILAKQTYRRFYMHGIGHFLGLDVHDAGNAYDKDGKPRKLRAGMVLTVEPGLYLSAGEVPPAFAGIGIRIEDDLLITKSGNEVLTADAPKTPATIRAWMHP